MGADTLAVLAGIDPASLAPRDQVHLLTCLDAHVAWLESLRNEAMLAVAGTEPSEDDEGREEVAAALRVSPASAYRRLEVARALATRLPMTELTLHLGGMSLTHASVIVEETATLTPEQAAQVEVEVLRVGATQTPGRLRATTRRAVMRIAPTPAAEAHEQAAAARRVEFWPGEHAMTTLFAELPAADAEIIRAALDVRAHADERDLPVDARRADALVALCAQALTDPDTPRRHGRPVQVHVAIDLPTLVGLANHPGHLRGYGPIPAPAARALARDATWRRLVTEPVTGRLLDFGRTTYTPPQELVDYITARDMTCTFPGCARAAWACDLDHTIPYAEGGPTAATNIRALCRRHHRLKTHKGWRTHTAEDGTITWISPTGATYSHPPRSTVP